MRSFGFAMAVAASLAALVALPVEARTRARAKINDCSDAVSSQQSVSSFGSLLDGQPTDPKRPTLSVAIARQQGTSIVQPVIQIAPGRGRGFCDAVLSLQLPAMQWDDHVTLSKTAGFGWEQRWHADDGSVPTLATNLSVTIDYSQPQPEIGASGTLIVAKTVGKVVLYGNAFLNYAKSPGSPALWTPGFVVGLKTPARDEDALVLDLVVPRDSPASFEIGYALSVPDNFSVGPGIAVTIEDRPVVTLGLVIQHEF